MPYLKKPVCQNHRAVNREDRVKIYSSSKWRKLRHSKLLANPLCELCLERDKVVPAVDVHHINSFMNHSGNRRLQLAYDYDNLLSLCKQCHQWLHRNGTTYSVDLKMEAKLLNETRT